MLVNLCYLHRAVSISAAGRCRVAHSLWAARVILKWRAGLKKFHAEVSAEILKKVGYSEEVIDKVRDLNQKKNLKTDADCQTLEDGLCIVFLRYQFDDLIHSTEHEKMINIVRKTWAKMSASGHAKALEVNYSKVGKAIIDEALA